MSRQYPSCRRSVPARRSVPCEFRPALSGVVEPAGRCWSRLAYYNVWGTCRWCPVGIADVDTAVVTRPAINEAVGFGERRCGKNIDPQSGKGTFGSVESGHDRRSRCTGERARYGVAGHEHTVRSATVGVDGNKLTETNGRVDKIRQQWVDMMWRDDKHQSGLGLLPTHRDQTPLSHGLDVGRPFVSDLYTR